MKKIVSMKKIVNILFIISILNVACEKETPPQNNDNLTQIDTVQSDIPSTADIIYDAVTDIDGNHYNAVRIGNQIWMASNLRTTRFANGEEIPTPTSSNDFFSSSYPRKYAPSNYLGYIPTYGYLYNWVAVMHNSAISDENPSGVQGVCPDGWHMPSDAEWTQLTEYVGTQNDFICSNSTNIAKALASNSGWSYNSITQCAVGYNVSTNNATGFSALPAGNAYQNNGADWKDFGTDANFWTSSGNRLYCNINSNAADVRKYTFNPPSSEYAYAGTVAFSVRCVQD